ncbi:LOW QUALITY PROTEIN: hypothetical protein HID58_052850, partial [Brassica napus]
EYSGVEIEKHPTSRIGGSSAFGHHIVKLTSTTYGLLTLDPPSSPPTTPPQKFTTGTDTKSLLSEPEVINSWELMSEVLKPLDPKPSERFERICPAGGENRVVIYTTSLRGVRRTFEECNAVRAAVEGSGVVICERDVSMDRGFREELTTLMAKRAGNDKASALPPRVFVKGMYIGGAEEVLRLVEEGVFGEMVRGLPSKKAGGCRRGGDGDGACDGCGSLFFLPCNGSCKVVKGWGSSAVVVRCTECNENGLVPCPICS